MRDLNVLIVIMLNVLTIIMPLNVLTIVIAIIMLNVPTIIIKTNEIKINHKNKRHSRNMSQWPRSWTGSEGHFPKAPILGFEIRQNTSSNSNISITFITHAVLVINKNVSVSDRGQIKSFKTGMKNVTWISSNKMTMEVTVCICCCLAKINTSTRGEGRYHATSR